MEHITLHVIQKFRSGTAILAAASFRHVTRPSNCIKDNVFPFTLAESEPLFIQIGLGVDTGASGNRDVSIATLNDPHLNIIRTRGNSGRPDVEIYFPHAVCAVHAFIRAENTSASR